MSENPSIRLYRRITNSVPLLVSVLLHAVLIAVVGYFVVTETIINRKKSFEPVPPPESSAKKQLDHRIQVARKSGGSSPSPLSVQRIFSTAENALQMPSMTELPKSGASALGSAGFGAGAGVVGGGSGYNTALGGGNGLGRGFMSMSFLGMMDVRAQKVVFVVDISSALLDIRKGGFQAFTVIKDQISKLVANMTPGAEFNVVLFDPGSQADINTHVRIETFSRDLKPATLANKTAFLQWMAPINTDMTVLGFGSVKDGLRWEPRKLDNAGLDPQYRATCWADAFRAALEMKPDTVFLITGRTSNGIRDATDQEMADRRKRRLALDQFYKSNNIDPAAVAAARGAAMKKASDELDVINKKQLAKKKDPFIIQGAGRILDADFQAALKKAGYSIVVDTKGWTDKNGRLMTNVGPIDLTQKEADWAGADLKDLRNYFWKLQAALCPQQKARLYLFLFVGPDENTTRAEADLKLIVTANDGRFSLLDTKKLVQMQKDAEAREAAKK